MFNEDILKEIIKEFGTQNALLFCKMEAFKYYLLLKNSSNIGNTHNEFDFEKDWWIQKYNELLKNIK